MRRCTWSSLSLAALVTASLATLAGCDPGTPKGTVSCSSSSDCAEGETCVDGVCTARSDGGRGDAGTGVYDAWVNAPVALIITPSSPEIVCTEGTATLDLEVEVSYADGTTRTSTAFWEADAPELGSIDRDSGLYTASCARAGTTTVTVEAAGLTTTTTLAVRIERTVLVDGATSDHAAHFDGTTGVDGAAEAVSLVYPLEGTVFPQNVHPADLQWTVGSAGDVYRVRAETTGVRIDAIVVHSGSGFGFHWQPDSASWRALAESAPEAPVTISIDRWVAASGLITPSTSTRTVRFADATIRGSIYYWDLANGQILRIAGDGTGLEVFMPSPPPSSSGSRCVACHAVSRDGTRMAAELWEGGEFGAIFDLTADLSTDPAPTIVAPTTVRFLTATFSPDNSRLVANYANELFLIDGNTGARLAAGGAGLPATGAANPAWSPDGAHVAYVANTNGSWAVDYTTGDLAIISADVATDSFGAPSTIVTGAVPDDSIRRTVARPSWSPDSGWLAFQHGQHSRAYSGVRQEAFVRMTSPDGATTFDLERLNAGASNSYYPTFSPFDEGGYFWLAFFSARDYGNSVVGTAGSGRRQLWVAAIDSTPTPGTDPSAAPYWIPQQNVAHENMAAFWAPEACHADGRTCATSGECCSGFCRDTGSGAMCVPPDEVECSQEGESCRDDSDCCEGAGTCSSNVCTNIG